MITYLAATKKEEGWYVSTCLEDELHQEGAPSIRRVSPIYPIAGEDASIEECQVIVFVCPRNFLNLINRQAFEFQQNLYFSLGICSLIYIGSKKEWAKFLKAERGNLVSFNVWEIDKDHKITEAATIIDPAVVDLTTYMVELDSSCVDSDTKALIVELNENLREFALNTAIYYQETLEQLGMLVSEIKYLVEKIKTLGVTQGINNITRLYSINSSFSYVISQGFYGAPPILDGCVPLVRGHSLLGVGNAHRAMTRYVRYIETAFLKDCVIEGLYKWEGLKDRNSSVEREEPSEDLSKLLYFSSRYGYGESLYVTTCAGQTLHAVDSVRWQLGTLTHELLHAHVDSILACLFTSKREDALANNLSEITDKLFQLKKTEKLDEFYKATFTKDSLAVFILEKICRYDQIMTQVRNGGSTCPDRCFDGVLEFKLTEVKIREGFVSGHRMLTEVMVHVLDLNYFYYENHKRYIESLWLSWASIPGVIENCQTYLIRTLVAIASSSEMDKSRTRLSDAKAIVNTVFEDLKKDTIASGLIIEAQKLLNSNRFGHMLALVFSPLCEIGDKILTYCYSRDLRLNLESHDPLISSSGTEKQYNLDSMSFDVNGVSNPVAFIVDRLAKNIDMRKKGLKQHDEEQQMSAWVFLMLSNEPLEDE